MLKNSTLHPSSVIISPHESEETLRSALAQAQWLHCEAHVRCVLLNPHLLTLSCTTVFDFNTH